MKIGLLCSSDWASYLCSINESLKSIGLETVAYKLAKHPFNYELELPIINPTSIKEAYKDCDIILIAHSDWELIDYLPNKPYGHIATGTKFRSRPEFINEKFKDSVINFTDQCEFMKLGNFHYLPVPIDTDKIKPIERNSKDVVFAHYPSNFDVKGSDIIDRIMVRKNYKTSRHRVFHNEQLERMQDCDVYIELFAHEQGGKPYGCFGVTAFEAAAMGKTVITMCNDLKVYTDVFYESPFLIVKTEQELANLVINIESVKFNPRELIVKNHSLKASGHRLYNLLKAWS